MTTKELTAAQVKTQENLDRLVQVVDSLAASVVSHDSQIEGLIAVAEKNSADLATTRESIAALERQWQAYINRLPSN